MKKLLLLIVSFFVLAPAVAENDRTFAWEISSAEDSSSLNTLYMMGSIHFADASFYPLRKEIEDAFTHSNHLVVELDVNKISHAEYNQIVSENGLLEKGRSIEDTLSKETWLQLRQRLKSLNISYDAVKNYKPGILVLMLAATQVAQLGFDAGLGIDVYFLKKAAQRKDMQIVELETLRQQLSLFIDIPDGELLLRESLYSMDEAELMMADMVRFWKHGDAIKMNELLFEDALNDYPSFGKIYDSLFYERNRKMVTKIDDMLKHRSATKQTSFVVVGSGHLIGDKGIVKLLQEKGYRVKRL